MVTVLPTQIIHVQRHMGVVHKALEELVEEVHIEVSDHCAGEGHMKLKARAPRKVDHNPRQGFIQGHVGVTVALDTLLVAHRLGERLPKGDADVFDGVVSVYVQITVCDDNEVHHAVAGDLIEHVLEKRQARIQVSLTAAIKVERHADLSFQRVALHVRAALCHVTLLCRLAASALNRANRCGFQGALLRGAPLYGQAGHRSLAILLGSTTCMDDFATRLLTWFDAHGRHDLPWQADATPYHVWLSEIMLQQTQVATVIPYYLRFTETFSSVEALAGADLDAVLHLWSGLGYYARARNLHAAARAVVDRHDGRFPADLEALEALPGIGRSTAGAILSSALDGRAPILDGNVKRVLARYHAVEGWPGRSGVAATLWSLAEKHTPHERVAAYTQGIMDLGATLCTRRAPRCPECPVAEGCVARASGRQTEFPASKPKRDKPVRQTTFAIIASARGEVFLERRPESGIWGGLWCFPEAQSTEDAQRLCVDRLADAPRDTRALPGLRHSFSHYHLDIAPVLLTLAGAPTRIGESDSLQPFPIDTVPGVGLAAPVKKIWNQTVAALQNSGSEYPQGELHL